MKKVFTSLILAAVLIFASVALAEVALAETAATSPPAIDLTGIINAVIAVLGALVTYRLLPWLKANTSAKQQQITQTAIATAVFAAEQLYSTNMVSDRLTYALQWLNDHGYTVDRAQVEAEVRRQKWGALEVCDTIDLTTQISGDGKLACDGISADELVGGGGND